MTEKLGLRLALVYQRSYEQRFAKSSISRYYLIMGDIIRFRPRGKEGESQPTVMSQAEEPSSSETSSQIVIPSLAALYDETKITFHGAPIVNARLLISERYQEGQSGWISANQNYERRLAFVRQVYIGEHIKNLTTRRRALANLAAYTYGRALLFDDDWLQSVCADKLYAYAPSRKRAIKIMESTRIKIELARRQDH
jgi:hypothetical protein